MSKPRHWWLAKSVSDDHDTLTAYDIDGDDEDWTAKKGIYVIEKSAADKLAEALEGVMSVSGTSCKHYHIAKQALAEYRGEDE